MSVIEIETTKSNIPNNTIDGKIEKLREIELLTRYFASEHRLGEKRVQNIIEKIIIKNLRLKDDRIVITSNLMLGTALVTKKGAEVNEREIRTISLSRAVCEAIRRDLRNELTRAYNENIFKKSSRLLENIVKTELRGCEVVRAKLVGFIKSINQYALRFVNKQGDFIGYPFVISKRGFLECDEIKVGNVFYVKVIDVDYIKEQKKIISIKVTRNAKEVFEAEFKNIFKKLLANKRGTPEYSDEVLDIVEKSILKYKIDKIGNIKCFIDSKNSKGVSLFFVELTRIYNSRFQKRFAFKCVG